jgi:hypothetical protein
LICLVVLVFSRRSDAQDWYLSPRFEATGEYNSNYFFSTNDKVSDYFTHLKPSFDFARETEDTQLHLVTNLNAEEHLLHSYLDTVEDDSQATLVHQWSARSSTTFSGSFARDETLNQELLAAGLITKRVERYSYGSGVSSDYALSENKKLTVGVNMMDTRYPGGQYPDMQLLDGRISPTWQFNSTNTVGFLADYSTADYSSAPVGGYTSSVTNRILATSLTWQHNLSDSTSFNASGGLNTNWVQSTNSLRIKQSVLEFKQQSTDQNFIGTFSYNKDWTERFSTTFAAGREQYNAVTAQSYEHIYIRTNAGYKLSERTLFGVELGYDSNTENGGGTNATNSDFFRVSPSLTRRISERLSLSFNTSYGYIMESGNQDRDQIRVWVSLVYDWPRALANH